MNATASTANTVNTVIALIVFNINVHLTSSSSLYFNVVRHLFREVASLCCPNLLLDPALTPAFDPVLSLLCPARMAFA